MLQKLIRGPRAALILLYHLLQKSPSSPKSILWKHRLKCLTQKHYEGLQNHHSSVLKHSVTTADKKKEG